MAFSGGKCFYQRRGLDWRYRQELSFYTSWIILNNLAGRSHMKFKVLFAQDEEQTKVGLSLSGLSDIQHLEVLM